MNVMRWDCQGGANCFNQKMRPKLGVFDNCFPGKIGFGDVDGIVEVNSRGLVMEWKTDQRPISTGQGLMWHRLTKSGMLETLCIVGNAETMDVQCFRRCRRGEWDNRWENADLAKTQELIKDWSSWAQRGGANA